MPEGMDTMDPDETAGDTITIAGVSEKLGIPVPTIRSWERRYAFPSPARTSGRHRRYTQADVEQLRALRDAITQGYPAREAVGLVRNGGAVDPAQRSQVDALLRAAVDLDPDAARTVLQEVTDSLGPEQAAVRVALPALQEVGARWKAGTCDVAGEHLMSDAIRAWLARLRTLAPPPRGPMPIVLCCGPKELHSIGLEAFGMILARRRWSVLLLGALTPTESLVKAVRDTRAPATVVVAQRSVNRRSTIESIAAVEQVPGVRVFFGGGAFSSPASRRGVPGTYLGTDLVAAADSVDLTVLR